jgi:tetratricopeptide (TPR) repeat protein
MKSRKLPAALAAGRTIAAGGWLLSRATSGNRPNAPRPDRAWNAIHEKVFLAEQFRRNPTHVPILIRLAQLERSAGNLPDARAYLEKAVVADAAQVDIRLELGLVDSELGDMAAAEEQNRAVLRIDSRQPDALYNLGAIAANRGDFALARQFWNDAIRTGANVDSVTKARKAVERLGELQ